MIHDLSTKFGTQKARESFDRLCNEGRVIELKRVFNKRTLSQNSYLHAVITLYAIHLGYSLDEAKQLIKRHCDFMNYYKDGEMYLRKTSSLNTKECSEFIDWIRTRASQEDCYIQSADEMKAEWQQIQSYIREHREWL